MSKTIDSGRSSKPIKLPTLSSSSLLLDLRPSLSPPRPPLFYNWESSLPSNSTKMSPRPLKRIPGIVGSRSTLDFLHETNRYITQITERGFKNKDEPRYPVSRLKPALFHREPTRGSRFWKVGDEESRQVAYRKKTKAVKEKEKKGKKVEYVLVGV